MKHLSTQFRVTSTENRKEWLDNLEDAQNLAHEWAQLYGRASIIIEFLDEDDNVVDSKTFLTLST